MAASKSSDEKKATKSVTNLSLRNLPGTSAHLNEVQDPSGKQLLKFARGIVKEVRGRLEDADSNLRMEEVEQLFVREAGSPREVPKSLETRMRRPEHAAAVARLDNAWDKTYAGALNTAEQAGVSVRAKVEGAEDAWHLAVRVYEAELRSAAAIFKAKVALARESSAGGRSGTDDAEADGEVDYYARSSQISSALVEYERSKATATRQLAAALGALMAALFDAVATLAVAEATLIDTVQSGFQTFWGGVSSELYKAR